MSLLCAEQVYQLQLASQTFDLHPLAFTIKSEKSRICHIPKLFLKAHFSKGIQCHFTLWSARFFPKGCALQTLTNFLPSFTKKVNCHLLVGKDIILCHFFIGILRRVYTQNIDALEVLGGAPEEKVIEAHGTFRESFCQACDAKYELSWLKDQIFKPETNDGVPKCTKCATGVVRPSVVFFGETLPRRFWENLDADFKQCDCLIVMGTSLAVAPFNALIARPPKTATRVFINKTKPGAVGFAGWMMGLGRNSVTFTNANDLVILDDCDKTVREICRQVNWEQELDALQVRILEP